MEIKQVFTRTDAGPRAVNEDVVLERAEVPLFAVADGMGGAGIGDAAAKIATEHLSAIAPELRVLADAVEQDPSSRNRLALSRAMETVFERCNDAVQAAAQAQKQPRMATTLLAATVVGNLAYIAHVGNCRAYLFRDDELLLLTDDHTVAMYQYRRGRISSDALRQKGNRDKLYQVIGVGSQPEVDIAEVSLADDDILLLCSDGLPRALSEEQIQKILVENPLELAADSLIHAARDAKGPDNVSLVLLRVGVELDPQEVRQVAQVLKETFLMKGFSDAERSLIAPYLERRSYAAGAVMASEDDDADELFLIIEGRVRVTHEHLHLLDITGGGHFGELGLARPTRRSATVTVVEPATFYSLSRRRFHEFIRSRPDLGVRLAMLLLDQIGDRLRDLTERLADSEKGQFRPPDPTDLPEDLERTVTEMPFPSMFLDPPAPPDPAALPRRE